MQNFPHILLNIAYAARLYSLYTDIVVAIKEKRVMQLEALCQLRQRRNDELMIEVWQARITQELIRNQEVEVDKLNTSRTNWLVLLVRYVFSILVTMVSVLH